MGDLKEQQVLNFVKGLNKDSNKLNVQPAEYIDGRNIVDSNKDGDILNVSNEGGFINLTPAPEHFNDNYQVIGHTPLSGIDKNNRSFNWEILFLVQQDNGISEVGVFDYDTDTYVTKVNDANLDQDINVSILTTINNTGTSLLNFSANYQIDATARQIFNLNRVVYFTDGLNPPRRLDLDQIDNFTDIDQETQLFQNFSLPVCEFVQMNDSGNVRVGAYQFVARYLSNDLTPTTFGIPCHPIPVVDEDSSVSWWEYDGANFDLQEGQKSITFDVKNLDQNFDYVEIAVIYYEESQSSLKVKIFDRQLITDTTLQVTFDGTFPDDAEELLLEDIIQQPISYKAAKHIIQKDNRLLLSNLKSSPIDFELQKIANGIEVYYEITELPHNIYLETPGVKVGYKDERNTYAYKGYQRGEVYSLSFGVIFKDGSLSSAYPIPGIGSTHADYAALIALIGATGTDSGFLTANTGTQRLGSYLSSTSTDIYTGVTERTRHHYIPTLEQEPHINADGTAIRVLGLRFDNIDFSVVDIAVREQLKNSIQGVYFAREERDTAQKKSIIAQGLFNRMMAGLSSNLAIKDNILQANPIAGDTAMKDKTASPNYLLAYGGSLAGDPGTDVYVADNFQAAVGDNRKEAQLYTQSHYAAFLSPESTIIKDNPDIDLVENITPELLMKSFDVDTTNINTVGPLFDSTGSEIAGFFHLLNYNQPVSATYPNEITYKPYYGGGSSQKRTIINGFYCKDESRDDIYIDATDASQALVYREIDTSGSGLVGIFDTARVFSKASDGYYFIELDSPTDTPSNVNLHYQEDKDLNILLGSTIYTPATNTDSNSIFYYDGVLNTTGANQGYSHELRFDVGGPFAFDNTTPIINSSHIRYLCNLRRKLDNQYGAPENSIYTIIEDYYFDLNECQFNLDVLEGDSTTYLSAYKGDTFISKFGVRHNVCFQPDRIYTDNKYQDRDGVHLRTITGFFVESTINVEYRHRVQNDDGTTGAPYWPRANDTPTAGAQTGGGFDGLDPDNVWTYNPVAGHSIGYNQQYSTENSIKQPVSSGLNFEFVTFYPTRTIYSQFSNEGEQSDRYKIFLPNDYYDLPKHTGEITNQFIWNQQLFLHTENSLWQTFFNSISAVASSLGEVYLGTGKAFSQPAQQLQSIDDGYAGCQHKWGSVTTPFGYYFIDAKQRKVFLLSDTLKEISYDGRMSKWFEENLWFEDNPRLYTDPLYNPNFHNNPANILGCGIVSVYDSKNRRIITTILNEAQDDGTFNTFSFSLNSLSFRSLHDYRMMMPFSNGIRLFSVHNHEDSFGLYEHNMGKYGQYYYSYPVYANPFPWYVTFIVNKYPDVAKTFSNLEVSMKVYDEEEDKELYDKFFNTIQCYNDFQNTGVVNLTLQYPDVTPDNSETNNVRYVNRDFRLAIPRDLVIDKGENIFDPTNLYTTLSAPDFLPKIKGKYIVVKLVGNNAVDTSVIPNRNYRFTLNYIRSLFRANLR
jgi:hypothetical protein